MKRVLSMKRNFPVLFINTNSNLCLGHWLYTKTLGIPRQRTYAQTAHTSTSSFFPVHASIVTIVSCVKGRAVKPL